MTPTRSLTPLVRLVGVGLVAVTVVIGSITPGFPGTAQAATIGDCADTVLRIGSTGPCVAVLQQALDDEQAKLNIQGYHLQVDGRYGRLTAQAVDAWENYAFLQSRNDNVAGPEVWASLQAPSGCTNRNLSRTVRRLRMAILYYDFVFTWCAVGSRVTGFVVNSAFPVVKNSWLAADARADVQPTVSLGSDHLHVYGDFSVAYRIDGSLTIGVDSGRTKASATLHAAPGRIGDHYELDLWANGGFTNRHWLA